MEDTRQITKTFADTEETIVVSSRVEVFEIVENDNVIEFTVKALGAGSTIVTKVSVRERILPTPQIG